MLTGTERLQALDMREWLAEADRIGDLTRVAEADSHLEVGAISELNYKRANPHALLFESIIGPRADTRLLTGSVSTARRLGMTLRLGSELGDAELVEQLRGMPNTWAARAGRYPAQEVADGPVLENRIAGADVNLLDFPAPVWHEHDGGPYIGTGCIVFTSDPETGVVNGGTYRMMVQPGGRTATVLIGAGKHGRLHLREWFEREGRAPVTISLGHDPLLLVLGGTDVPLGISELDYAGAIMEAPVEYIKAGNGLPIPARSELVLEGWLRPDRVADEGPFGEWTGYYSKSERPQLELEIANLYHRNNPILLGSPPGRPPHDYSYMRSAMKSAMVLDALVGAGLPGVQSVWAHEAGGGRLLLVVGIKQAYCGHSRQAGFIAAQAQAAAYMNRYVIVVEEDIDTRDLDHVMWAVCTRSDPAEDIEIMRKSWGSPADPLLFGSAAPYNSRAVIDACRPFERLDDFPRIAESDPAWLREVGTKWASVLDS